MVFGDISDILQILGHDLIFDQWIHPWYNFDMEIHGFLREMIDISMVAAWHVNVSKHLGFYVPSGYLT